MTELDKLEQYLKDNKIKYERYDVTRSWESDDLTFLMDRHQICVPQDGEGCLWDAICQHGSYGYEDGLIEIYGCIVPDNVGDSVEGFLTAQDVIERINAYERFH